MKKITIHTEFITLGQFLKYIHEVASGAEAKIYLQENKVLVNDLVENRRGRKLYPGDIVTLGSRKYQIEV